MKTRLGVLLLAVCLAAGALYFVADARRSSGLGPGEWARPNPGDVRQVSLKNDSGAFTLARVGREWFMDMPDGSRLRADAEKVGGLVRFVGLSRPLQRLGAADGRALRQAGLAQPTAEVAVDGLRLSLGAAKPRGEGVFALSGRDRELLLLHPDYAEWLRRGPEFYLDAHVLSGAATDVAAVRLVRGKVPAWEVRRRGEGYAFDLPAERRDAAVAANQLGLYLHEVAAIRALSLPAEAPAKGAAPALELLVWSASSKEPQRLAVFAREGGAAEGPRYVGVSSWQPAPFTLDQERVARLTVTAFTLSDRRLLRLDLGKVARVLLRQDGRAITVHKTRDGWATDNASIPVTGLDMYLWRLTDLTYLDEPREVRPAAAAPKLSMDLGDEKGEILARLSFFLAPDLPKGRCLVQVGDRDLYYPADDQVLKDLAGQLPLLEGDGRRQHDPVRPAPGGPAKE